VSWPEDSIRHYRKEADTLQAEIDRLTDPRWLSAQVDSMTKRRDLWLIMAAELVDHQMRSADVALFEEG